jgi:mRNA-degrading endonuclease RelE of RelBE toxin-antitoxin system
MYGIAVQSLMFSFIETKLFTRLVQEYLSDDEYQELQKLLMDEPDAGDVIPNTGGVRKLRWQAAGRGKRSGYRVIYFTRIEAGLIWMLTMYPKNVKANIPAKTLRKIREEAEDA